MTILLGRFAGGNSILLNRFGTRTGDTPIAKPYNVYGSVYLDFMNDLKNLIISGNWGTDAYGREPRISKVYDRRVTNFATVRGDNILIYVERESMNPYSTGTKFATRRGKWLHTLHGSIEITSNISEVRCQQITSAVTDILKNNVNFDDYIMVTIHGVTNRNNESRNFYRHIIDVSARKYAPYEVHL